MNVLERMRINLYEHDRERGSAAVWRRLRLGQLKQ